MGIVPSSLCNSVISKVTLVTMTPRHLSLIDVVSNMFNISHVGFLPLWFTLPFERSTW